MSLRASERHTFELMMVVLAVGIAVIYLVLGEQKIIVLNLFFLPIVLAGYFLGRFTAGLLALFCAIAATIATLLDPTGLANFSTPVLVGLALTTWAAALGLTALLVGTLCDERAATLRELHKAYVGVVEILSKYLQSANPRMKALSIRIAELSQAIAEEMNLSAKRVDDIRVAALLHDLGNVEVTTQLAGRAIDALQSPRNAHAERFTFLGVDLVQSLGSVLEGAMPLVLSQNDALRDYMRSEAATSRSDVPLGAEIIRVARVYVSATDELSEPSAASHQAALDELLADSPEVYNTAVVQALARVARRNGRRFEPTPSATAGASL